MTRTGHCPKCGASLSRMQVFLSIRFDYRCPSCNALSYTTALGYVLTFLAVAVQFTWYVLAIKRHIRPATAIAGLLATTVLIVWLLPIAIPMKLREETKPAPPPS